MPAGITGVDVVLEYTGAEHRTVIDLGLRSPSGVRGWSGGRGKHVFVSQLSASPGYLPGPIEAGKWSVLLGIPNIRHDTTDTYRVTVSLHRGSPLVGRPVLKQTAAWYAGDLHMHSGHSDGWGTSLTGQRIPGTAMRVFDLAAAAELDFAMLSDHNTAAHWLDVDRMQPYYDTLLLLHGREITTYRGHANVTGDRAFTDFTLATPTTPIVPMLKRVVADGAFLSINHPLRPDDETCMGCGWNDLSDDVMSLVNGIEVVNGDARTPPYYNWPFWAEQLNRGYRLTAVGGSDDHTPEAPDDQKAGTPTTVVWARELSEAAIVEGLQAGKTYVRVLGPAGPSLELRARATGREFTLGDTIPIGQASSAAGVAAKQAVADNGGGTVPVTLDATVSSATGQTLQWIRNGAVASAVRCRRAARSHGVSRRVPATG